MVDGLSIEDLVVRADRHDLVDGLELSLGPGSVLGIVGPSGSGKTTLLRTLGGLRSPHAGRVTLGGSPVVPSEVGYVSQEHVLLGRLTAAENVAVRLLAVKDRRSGDDVSALLGGLGLPESSWHNLVEQLSGGQQQRVAVARALAGRPRLLCLDDPTSELDEASAALVWEQVAVAVAAGAIAVLAVAEVPEGLEPDAIVSTAVPS